MMPRKEKHEKRRDRATRLEIAALQSIARDFRLLVAVHVFNEPQSFDIKGENGMGALVLVIGTTRTFDLVDNPAGTQVPAGVIPTWATDDTVNTTLSPSDDGLKCSVAGANDPTLVGKTFNLSVSAAVPDTSTTPPGTKTITSGPKLVTFTAPVVVVPVPTSFDIAEEPAA